ncbi:hypothetical protein ACJX0J_040502, partial [Zea mays]
MDSCVEGIARTKALAEKNMQDILVQREHAEKHRLAEFLDPEVKRWFEKYLRQMVDGAFCVTKAMQHELAQNWGIRLGNSICSAMGNAKCISVEEVWEDMNITVFASKIDGEVFLKSNRPALVSSTSWTPDEDFSILLEAVLMYDRRVAAALGEDVSTDEEQLWIDIKNGKQFVYPRLLFIITGKGPDRKKYEDQIKRLKLRRVALRTMWLASEDYPLLL